MKYHRLIVAALVYACLLLTQPALQAQQRVLLCDSDVSCGPNPTGTTTTVYDRAVAARTQIINQRGPVHPLTVVGRTPMARNVLGSRSYDYSINLVSLAGRNNTNLNLSLTYNSRVWSRSVDGLTLNSDIDNPSLGFRGVDFGFLQWNIANSDWILTASNGSKSELINVGTNLYQSQDSTYIQFNSSTNVLIYRDGTQVFYEQFGPAPFSSTSALRPNKIESTNGNFISITYTDTIHLSVNSIIDTLGRIVSFAYDASGRLGSITQGSRTITFGWNTAYVLNYSFSLPVIASPATGSVQSVLSSVTFADHTTVNFLYGDWGVVNRIERRSTNGTLRAFVSYNFPAASAGALSDAPAFTQQTIFDGVNTSPWNYSVVQNSSGLVTSSSVTDPFGTTTATTFSSAGDWKDGLPLTEQVIDSNHKIWRTRTKTWTSDTGTSAVNPRVASVLTQLDDGTQSAISYAYDANGNITDQQETDFAAGAPGPLLRETVTSYAALGNHILNRPAQVLEKNSTSTLSRTDFGYDEYSSVPLQPVTPAAGQHDDLNYSVSSTNARGNLTTKTVYANAATATGAIKTILTYDVLGNRVAIQEGCCTQAHSVFSAGTQYGLPDSVTTGPLGSQLTASFTYNLNSGTVASSTDANGQPTTYTYDLNNRVTSTRTPDGIVTTTSYDDTSANPGWTSSTTADSRLTTVVNDFTGHELSNKLFNGTTLVSTTSSSHDALGRVTQSSNPYGPADTPVYTTYTYDALGRTTQRTPPALTAGVSQSGYQTSYSGHTATFADPTGRQRKEYHNSLGDLVEVDEPGIIPSANNYATMQTDGNFVLYDPSNRPLWASGTAGVANASSILMQDDGNLVLYVFKWFAGTYAAPTPGSYPPQGCSIGTYLMVGQRLNANQCIVSPHGQYMLYMASDGNFFIYDLAHGTGTWGPGTYGHPGAFAMLQTDGNFVVYDANGVGLWSSGTYGTFSERLDMEDDGRIIIYKSAWSSGTSNGQFNETSIAHPACDVGIGTGWTGVLGTGSCFVSPNGHFELLLQSDGNMVIYDRSVNPPHALWSTQTALTSLSPGVALATTYSYDGLGNLLQVNQGQQVRSFTYDSLGRISSLKIPEKANQTVSLTHTDFGAIATRTDARGVTTTYGYDSLGHLTSIKYSDGTPAVTYSFGAAGAPNFGAGRLLTTTDGAGSESYQYDSMGREIKCTRVIGANTYVITYSYAPDGRIASTTYPSGRVVTNQYDNIGRLTQVGTGGANLFNVSSYNAAGQILSALYGNGIQASYSYNNQLQVASILVGNSSPILNLGYNWGGATDDGLLMGVTDNVTSTRTTSYTYDQLKRLTTAQTVNLTSPGTWQLQFAYDRYGNRLSQTPTGGTASMPSNSVVVDPTTNRITSAGYDADGNMINDGINAYTFDAESRITHVNGTANSYAYDGAGQRVNRNGNYYVYAGGHVIAEYANAALAASPTTEYVYARNKRVAVIAAGVTTYPYWDHLSVRANANSAGTVVRTFGHFPFGETWYETGTHDKWDYTTYENDAESGLNYAMARFHNPRLGRFMSLDPWPADRHNPQSWNRYPHGNNNPVSFSDPSGMSGCDDEGGDCASGDGGGDGSETSMDQAPDNEGSGGDSAGADGSGLSSGPDSGPICGDGHCSGSDSSGDQGDQNTDQSNSDQNSKQNDPNPKTSNCLPVGESGPPTQECVAALARQEIPAELAAYNQCVESSPFNSFEPEKPDVPEPPSGGNADMGVSPNDGAPPLPSNNEFFIGTMKSCLAKHPLAALSSQFQGLDPGNVF
ncbi:MAG TPA: RHS repeat-associated core domain-containing protein [Candidatus Angelobacter sp.]